MQLPNRQYYKLSTPQKEALANFGIMQNGYGDYYPFGLTMAGISAKAAGMVKNKKHYNGKEEQREEFSDGSGLELMDYGARMYDNQIGRFTTLDPAGEKIYSDGLYNYANNSPILYTDPTGKIGEPTVNNGVLTIRAKIVSYGTGATPENVKTFINNLNTQYNNDYHSVTYKGVTYECDKLKYEFTDGGIQQDMVSLKVAMQKNNGNNFDPQLNFARMEPGAQPMTSVNPDGYATGGNSMLINSDQIKPGNTTGSHEIGHSFGNIDHANEVSIEGKIPSAIVGPPSMGSTIFSNVAPQYTMNGKTAPKFIPLSSSTFGYEVKNPLNQFKRIVTNADSKKFSFITRQNKNAIGNTSSDLFNSNCQPIAPNTITQ